MRWPSKTAIFWILLAAAAVAAFLLPPAWTARLRGLFQPLALLQMPVTWAVQAAIGTGGATSQPAVAPEEWRGLLEENQALQRQVLHQRARLAQAEARIAELTGLVGQPGDSRMRVIFAPVVGLDANPRRATLLITINERQRRLLRAGQWVVAAASVVPEWDPAPAVRDLVERQWLIGRVSEVLPRLARVQLTSDPAFRVEAWAARVLPDENEKDWKRWKLASGSCVLVGVGSDEMRISQASEDYFKAGYQMVVVPAGHELPAPLSLGRIAGTLRRTDSPHHYDVRVVPWAPASTLSHVYVIASEP